MLVPYCWNGQLIANDGNDTFHCTVTMVKSLQFQTSKIVLVGCSLPLFSIIACILISVTLHFDESTGTHCKVRINLYVTFSFKFYQFVAEPSYLLFFVFSFLFISLSYFLKVKWSNKITGKKIHKTCSSSKGTFRFFTFVFLLRRNKPYNFFKHFCSVVKQVSLNLKNRKISLCCLGYKI